MRITALILFLYSSFLITAQANEENKQCVSEFQVDKAVCLTDFEETKRASCMQTATRNKKICLAGGELIVEIRLVPAEMARVSFKELGLPEETSIMGSHSSNLDKGLPEVEAIEGYLEIGTPGDTGKDEVYPIKLTSPLVSKMTLLLKVSTTRPLSAWSFEESSEAATAPELIIKGLGKYNTIGASDLSLSINVPGTLSSSASEFDITDSKGNIINVTDEFILDPATNTFTASGVALSTIIDQMQGGDFSFGANLLSEDWEFSADYSFELLKPTVTLTGQLIDSSGALLSGNAIDDLNIAIVGDKFNIRRVVPVDKKGQFVFTDLIRDQYALDVMDLQQSGVHGSSVAVFSGSTNVHINIHYYPLPSSTALKKSNNSMNKKEVLSIPAPKQNGLPPTARDHLIPFQQSKNDITLLAASAPTSGCPITVGADTYYIVKSAVEDKVFFCQVDYTASETATEIMMEVKVSTAEFPSYTRSQSEFNDA